MKVVHDMSSNDSPSVKPDGTAEAATLAAEYEEFLLDIEEQPLPGYRTDELRVRIEEVRATLATEGVAAAGQLQQLLRTVTEALADVRAARIVPAPEGRDLSAAVPGAPDTGAAYEVTETERASATNVLVNLLFTVVETPTHGDRRRAVEASDGASDAGGGAGDAGSGASADADSGASADADSGASADADSGASADADTDTTTETDADDTDDTSGSFGIETYPGPE